MLVIFDKVALQIRPGTLEVFSGSTAAQTTDSKRIHVG